MTSASVTPGKVGRDRCRTRVPGHTDRLDVLINNAGTPGNGTAPAAATVKEIHAVDDTNVYGAIRPDR